MDPILLVHEKLDKIQDNLSQINVTIAKQEVNLENHMQRTEANEKQLEILKGDVKPALEAYKFVAIFNKIVAGIVALGASIAAVWHQIKF